MMPNDLPPWHVVYQQTQRWLAAGAFQTLVNDPRAVIRIANGCSEKPIAVTLDSRGVQSVSGSRAGTVRFNSSRLGWSSIGIDNR